MIVAGGALLAAPAARAQGEMIEYWIDESRSSANQDSRIRTLVFHYTAEDFATSLKLLTEPQYRTSAHYLVPDAATLSRRPPFCAWWRRSGGLARRRQLLAGQRYLNGASIGVEIVNRGYPSPLQDDWPPMRRDWQAFDDAQIAQVGKLAAGIVARHRIRPCDVVGHADIAPGGRWTRAEVSLGEIAPGVRRRRLAGS
ncbi:N-acetylmuramoyl-L-alanine amidase AmiD precursor [Chromobacterium violaceum]|uniref:N-acetylmuramoyl-L-alanine amidase n=1 Tax=Chromobacterium violaceum TaxID=536 RepID=A0A3S5DLA8_CHRVL|nr:N-acetylmuramoyl-L-alanine amidase AmiD precursor [Chromobacterium violaceum]